MKHRSILVACALAAVFAIPCAGQNFTPVVAVYRRRFFNVSAAGTVTLVKESQGRYLRAADGTTLKTWQRYVNGQPTGPERGVFTDGKSGLTYSVNYARNQAQVRFKAPVPLTWNHEPPKDSLGRSSYDGLPCTLTPVRMGTGGPVAGGTLIGHACRNLQLGLTLLIELRIPNTAGGYGQVVFDLQDVQVGRNPDPSALALPAGAAVFER